MRTLITSILAAITTLTGAASAQHTPDLDRSREQVLRAEAGRALAVDRRVAPETLVAGYLRTRGKSEQVIASLSAESRRAGARGVTHLRMKQHIEGLEVYGAYVRAAVNARGELVHMIDRSAPVNRPLPSSIDAREAVRAALKSLYPAAAVTLGRGRKQGNTTSFYAGRFFYGEPSAEAVVLHLDDGSLARGWRVETWTLRTNRLHHTIVSGDGRVLEVERRTATDSYNVFPIHPTAGGQQVTSGAGAGNVESPSGWLSGTQTTLGISGNNAFAYLDRNNDDAADGGGTAATDNFLAIANLNAEPTSATNQEVSVQNLFYLNNRIHDILYRHGFDEAAANFQQDNFGNGGRGTDPVQAEAQDGGGTDNANFATPNEGRAPRMQMFLWTGAGPTHQVQVAGGASFDAQGADFGPALTPAGVTGTLAAATPADGCTAIGAGVAGKIALIDRGTCEFGLKALNAQQAGATGVVIANNDAANPDDEFPMGAGASGGSVTISAVMVSKNSGDALKALSAPTVTLSRLALQPLQIDASIDSDIVYHEYCHGLTWRMIGRMSGPLAGAIGEGMADGCALLINDQNDVIAEYSASDPNGIRSAPYTNHPRSYGDIGVAAGSPQVHFDGEIYAAIVWKLIQDFGVSQRDRLFGYIVDGMNYTPANPEYEDMRDGILAAVAASGNVADCAKVWDAFAHYGVGVGAEGAVRGPRIVITESMISSSSCN